MMADSGLQSGDYLKSLELCENLFDQVQSFRKNGKGLKGKELDEGAEVAWRNCYQLGKHNEFNNLAARMKLLGQALILCPGNQISTLLPLWLDLEYQLDPLSSPVSPAPPNSSSNHLTTSLQFLADPSSLSPALAAEAAARTFSRAAAFFPFRSTNDSNPLAGVLGNLERSSTSLSNSSSHTPPPPRQNIDYAAGMRDGVGGLATAAGAAAGGFSTRLTKGMDWLIGADEGAFEHE